MGKKKDILKKAKEHLKSRKESLIQELDKLYKSREKECNLDSINSRIDECIEEISMIEQDLARKDKKSSSIVWSDPDYKATSRGSGAKNAKIVDKKEYNRFQDKKFSFDSGPQALWLKTGILVKTKGRTMPGIVVETRNNYATVLFGGVEVDVRKLALRPADWDL